MVTSRLEGQLMSSSFPLTLTASRSPSPSHRPPSPSSLALAHALAPSPSPSHYPPRHIALQYLPSPLRRRVPGGRLQPPEPDGDLPRQALLLDLAGRAPSRVASSRKGACDICVATALGSPSSSAVKLGPQSRHKSFLCPWMNSVEIPLTTATPFASSSSSSSSSDASGLCFSSSTKTPLSVKPCFSRERWFDDLTVLHPKIVQKLITTLSAYGTDNKNLILTRFL
ncbi:hypothetical protein Taro_036108, partial [Colocasia esculenta]|nr:hypothetical protein [Colocasia esculenta]